MKPFEIFSALLTFCAGILVVVHLSSHQQHYIVSRTSEYGGRRSGNGGIDMHALMEVISVQNDTIYTLEAHLKNLQKRDATTSKAYSLAESTAAAREEGERTIAELYQRINRLTEELAHHKNLITATQTAASGKPAVAIAPNAMCPNSTITSSTSILPDQSSLPYVTGSAVVPRTTMERDCEARYGLELVSSWRAAKEVWCSSAASDEHKEGKEEEEEVLRCYPYHQKHKQLDGRGPDVFCEARNFVLDFSKIHGQVSEQRKPAKGTEYLQFGTGALRSSCRKTARYQAGRARFMPHQALLMRAFQSEAATTEVDLVVDTPTYLLARDEDCENSFHSTADFMNMFLVYSALGLRFEDAQVLLLDKYPDGPYSELIRRAFSSSHAVLRHTHAAYAGKRVRFRRLVLHLESPAGLIFPKVSRPDPLRCYRTSLFDAYRRHVLQAFDLLDVPPPAIPTVTLSLRHRTPQKNVGRVMANEQAVVEVLQQGNLMDLNVVDTAKMSYGEQLKLIRNSNVLVGIHGAGLMLTMFAADEAVLVEIHPSYRQDRHFRHAARMTGKVYMPLRSTVRETCSGSSDAVTVPVEEFRRTMDGALRIARSFDDGLSECGLVCPPQILALDPRLNGHYKSGETRSKPINTRFPCG